MTGVVHPHIKFTSRDYASLPDDGRRFELLDGELVPMSPAPLSRHQKIVMNLSFVLHGWARALRLGEVLASPIDVLLGDDNVLQPDLLFVAARRRKIIERRGIRGAPDLIVEVLSSDAARDREVKRRIYGRYGVREYWIVDPDREVVEVYEHPERGFTLRQSFPQGTTITTPLLPGLELPVAAVFEGLEGLDREGGPDAPGATEA